ncbi:PAZ domain-containing protein [Tanacetum coccineum]|uniref:PAZ domain-containing protein n=1 Tax=Tanacetum coccineum TaxID=301880 RepID=A0ABQ5AIK7_9ASTR
MHKSCSSVTITPEVTSKTKCKHIMKCLIEQYKASHLGNHRFAYDGNKRAFAAGPLPFENKEFVIVVPEKDGRQHEFKVAVKFVVTKDIDHLRKLLSGRQHDNPQETIQALDIVLREAASHERIIVGRSIFSSPLGNGVDYCRGFYQSLRPTGMGLSLSIGVYFIEHVKCPASGNSVIEEQALEIGSRKSVRKLFDSYDLLDLIKSFQIGRQTEIQSLLEVGPSLLKGRFLRFVQDKKSTSVAASELGLLKQTHTVSDLMVYEELNVFCSHAFALKWSILLVGIKGFLSRADSDDQIHDERHSDSSSNNGMGCHRENFQELPNDTVDEESHDEPQSDTTSNNGMNYHQENSQELPDDIADESQTIITRNNAGGADKIDSSTEICGSFREYDVPVKERHRVLDYERVQLLPQTETVESSGEYHDGLDDRSRQTHHFNLSQQTLELESDYDTAELRELWNIRIVSNLLQNGFGLRRDELLRSHVERQEQASQSEQQESVFENDGVSQFRAQKVLSLRHQPSHSFRELDIINGLRIDMVRLQEQMNSLQSTLETCMKMQHELQRSVQQEVWSALSRLSTSGEDSLETCFLCCDNSSYDFSSDRCGRVHVCSNCAKKINWSKLKESVRHP